MEISAKKPAPFLRQVVSVKKQVSEEILVYVDCVFNIVSSFMELLVLCLCFVLQTLRDPRFDDLSGEYKADIFESTYKFINDIKKKEKEVSTGMEACRLNLKTKL